MLRARLEKNEDEWEDCYGGALEIESNSTTAGRQVLAKLTAGEQSWDHDGSGGNARRRTHAHTLTYRSGDENLKKTGFRIK